MAAFIFSFVTSFDNVVVSIYLIGADTVTLPVRILTYVEWQFDSIHRRDFDDFHRRHHGDGDCERKNHRGWRRRLGRALTPIAGTAGRALSSKIFCVFAPIGIASTAGIVSR